MEERPPARITAPPGYTRQEFLLEHERTLFHNMPDWSTNELRQAPEQLTPYLNLLRRTKYLILHAKNLLQLINY